MLVPRSPRPCSPRARRALRAGVLAVCTVAVAASLAACTDTGEPSDDGAATSTAQPSESPSGEPSATPSPTPTPISVPLTVDCEALVPLQAVYDFNPNFGFDADYTPTTGTMPAELVELEGTACGFVNLTSGETIEFAVAHLVPHELQKAKDDLIVANDPVPIYVGDEGYFTIMDEMGHAQVFTGEYWLVARSSAFYEPGDHAALVNAVTESLQSLQP